VLHYALTVLRFFAVTVTPCAVSSACRSYGWFLHTPHGYLYGRLPRTDCLVSSGSAWFTLHRCIRAAYLHLPTLRLADYCLGWTMPDYTPPPSALPRSDCTPQFSSTVTHTRLPRIYHYTRLDGYIPRTAVGGTDVSRLLHTRLLIYTHHTALHLRSTSSLLLVLRAPAFSLQLPRTVVVRHAACLTTYRYPARSSLPRHHALVGYVCACHLAVGCLPLVLPALCLPCGSGCHCLPTTPSPPLRLVTVVRWVHVRFGSVAVLLPWTPPHTFAYALPLPVTYPTCPHAAATYHALDSSGSAAVSGGWFYRLPGYATAVTFWVIPHHGSFCGSLVHRLPRLWITHIRTVLRLPHHLPAFAAFALVTHITTHVPHHTCRTYLPTRYRTPAVHHAVLTTLVGRTATARVLPLPAAQILLPVTAHGFYLRTPLRLRFYRTLCMVTVGCHYAILRTHYHHGSCRIPHRIPSLPRVTCSSVYYMVLVPVHVGCRLFCYVTYTPFWLPLRLPRAIGCYHGSHATPGSSSPPLHRTRALPTRYTRLPTPGWTGSAHNACRSYTAILLPRPYAYLPHYYYAYCYARFTCLCRWDGSGYRRVHTC